MSRIEIEGLEDFTLLGKGGFAMVFRAYQPKFDRHVAVKVLSDSGFDEKIKRRFAREQQAMGSLSNHPGIVTLFDAGFTGDGAPYLVMELMSGGSMQDRIRRDGTVPWQEAVEVIRRIADAVAKAHAKGVLHRDIKPDNILVSEFGETKLTDFGIATLVEGAATATTSVTATLEYAPPEVLSGDQAVEASDVYALAATLFALVSGRSPFKGEPGEAPVAILTRVLSAPIPDLRAEGIPVPICEAIEWATAKRPGDRPPTATEFAAVLADAARRAETEDPEQWSSTRVITPEMVAAAEPPSGAGVPADEEAAAPERRSRVPLLIGGLVLAAAAVAIPLVVMGGGGSDPVEGDGTATTAAAGAATTAGEAPGTTGAATATTAPAWACAGGETALVVEDFEDGAAQGWNGIGDADAAWEIAIDPDDDGNSILQAGYAGEQQISSAVYGPRSFQRVAVRFSMAMLGTDRKALQLDWRFAGPLQVGGEELGALTLAAQFEADRGTLVRLATPAGGGNPEATELGSWELTDGGDASAWRGYEVLAGIDIFEIWIDGMLMASVDLPADAPADLALLAFVEGTGGGIAFDAVRVCELGADGAFAPQWPWPYSGGGGGS